MARSGDRIARIIAEYDAQGVHRTGTSVDLASAAWMKSRINELGLPSEEDRFSFKRVALGLNRFELGEVSIEGVPMYDGTFTAPEGVAGWLGAIGSDAESYGDRHTAHRSLCAGVCCRIFRRQARWTCRPRQAQIFDSNSPPLSAHTKHSGASLER